MFLGIDTSAYKTSVAVVDSDGKLVCDYRKLLVVKKGSRGLRQQEAVFQHVNNLPVLFECVSKEINPSVIKSIVSSTRPRNIEGSYMPVFNVSKNQGIILSSMLNTRWYDCSHQEGHLASAILGINELKNNDFLFYHISGGTTELLKVHRENGYVFDIEIIGGTKDISCGQLIDRIGVKMDLEFPSGEHVETLSKNGQVIKGKLPVNVKDTWVNYSGAETFLFKLLDGDISKGDVAKSVLHIVAMSLSKTIANGAKKHKLKDVIISGGVASNRYIRSIIIDEIGENLNIHFPPIEYCSDSAIGNAYIGYLRDSKTQI